jgi:hypothetical protein
MRAMVVIEEASLGGNYSRYRTPQDRDEACWEMLAPRKI